MRAFSWCSLFGCHPVPGTCLCTRCGRERHAWKIVASQEIQKELVGRLNDKYIYDYTNLVREVCSRCGVSREREQIVHGK